MANCSLGLLHWSGYQRRVRFIPVVCLTTATSEQLVHTILHAQLKNMRQAANPLTRIEIVSPDKALERPSYGIRVGKMDAPGKGIVIAFRVCRLIKSSDGAFPIL
jgi:2-phospho-L-lactate guanylyltransferase (CobY/MobA/RfbA family)